MEEVVGKFDCYIKNIKRTKKTNYVDVIITYEVKHQDIVDFIEVNCCIYPTITFKNLENQNDKRIYVILKKELDANGKVPLEELINHTNAQKRDEKTQFILSFLKYVKLNIRNHVLLLKLLKKLPDPKYEYQSDQNLKNEMTEYINNLQIQIREQTAEQQPQKLYIYFLETPINVNLKKVVKICIRNQPNLQADYLNKPYIFECNLLGCLEVPDRQQIKESPDDYLEDIMQSLLPKHCIFIVLALENLNQNDIVGGYYKISQEFKNGFKMVAEYIATEKVPQS